ncbi:MAG: thioesterase family protein [Aliiglaciecola sp.]
MSETFTTLLRIRYAECDAQQVVFNSRYAEYADLAATEFIRAILGGYQSLIDRGLDNQVVNLNISWKSSARFDDVLRLETWVPKVGNSSFTMTTMIKQFESHELVAEVTTTYVFVDAKSYQKTSIPDDIRKKLLTGAPNVTVNLAGIELK